MAKLYYRGMATANGKPKVGRSARLLGVRLEKLDRLIQLTGEQIWHGYLAYQLNVIDGFASFEK